MKETIIKPEKIVWALIPTTQCNFNCSYCYNKGRRKEEGKFIYSVEHMLECLKPERFGGPVFFGAVSVGETFLWKDIVQFTEGMLSMGHIVSYTSNGTITSVIKQFCNYPAKLRSGLEIDLSFHYFELKRTKQLDLYFENIKMLKSAGISFAIFLVAADDYLPYLREISELCQEKAGVLPIIGMERDYNHRGGKNVKKYTPEIEKLLEETCNTNQWHIQKQLYGKQRKEFCLAGYNSINMNLGNGNYTKCWGVDRSGNLFKDPNSKIKFEPIGFCPFYDCVCASYQCWGLIPELDLPTHSKTFFTRSSVSERVWIFMDYKMADKLNTRSINGFNLLRYKLKHKINRFDIIMKEGGHKIKNILK